MKIAIIGNPLCIHFRKRLQAFISEKHDITLITEDDKVSEYAHVQTFSLKSVHGLFKKIRKWSRYFFFLKKSSFDVIYIFSGTHYLCWITQIFSTSPIMIATIGSDILDTKHLSWLEKKLSFGFLKIAARVTVLSSYMSQILSAQGIPQDILYLDYFRIDASWFHPVDNQRLQKELQLEKAYPIILSCRVLKPLYRIEVLLESLAVLKKTYPSIKLLQSCYLIDQTYEKKIKDLVRQYGLEKDVCFLSATLSEKDFQRIYTLSDVVVMVPSTDGMPSSLIEAWACKKPVVTSNIPHYDPTWHGKLLIKSDVDPLSLSQTIQDLLENPILRHTLTENGFTYASQHYKGTDFNRDLLIISLPSFLKRQINRIYGIGLLSLYSLHYLWERFKIVR